MLQGMLRSWVAGRGRSHTCKGVPAARKALGRRRRACYACPTGGRAPAALLASRALRECISSKWKRSGHPLIDRPFRDSRGPSGKRAARTRAVQLHWVVAGVVPSRVERWGGQQLLLSGWHATAPCASLWGGKGFLCRHTGGAPWRQRTALDRAVSRTGWKYARRAPQSQSSLLSLGTRIPGLAAQRNSGRGRDAELTSQCARRQCFDSRRTGTLIGR